MSTAAPSHPLLRLRYASHLGYRSPDTPLYRESVNAADVRRHVAFAAANGFAGVQYALAVSRPVEERRAFAAAMHECGLEAGCMLYAVGESMLQPLWARSTTTTKAEISARLEAAFRVAEEVGSNHIAVLSGAEPGEPLGPQHTALVENLKHAADLADAAGVTICIEAISDVRFKNMLLHHVPDALEVLRKVANPRVRLAFDTSHTQVMDGDVLHHWRESLPFTDLLQLAEGPDRLEPGSGQLDFTPILAEAMRCNFRGLVELEHGWSENAARCEAKGLDMLRAFDAAAARQVGG